MGRLELGQVQTILPGKVLDAHATQGPQCTGREPKFNEAVLGRDPDALGLQVGKLALLCLDVRVRDLVGHIRALTGQGADASHNGLH
jgi:hypothetical protein